MAFVLSNCGKQKMDMVMLRTRKVRTGKKCFGTVKSVRQINVKP